MRLNIRLREKRDAKLISILSKVEEGELSEFVRQILRKHLLRQHFHMKGKSLPEGRLEENSPKDSKPSHPTHTLNSEASALGKLCPQDETTRGGGF
jgi:hypothetical protein